MRRLRAAAVDRSKIGTTCVLIRGSEAPGRFLRTVTHADPLNVGLPSNVMCPSGTGLQPDSVLCLPITTPVQLFVLLQAEQGIGQGCNDTVAQFLQQTLLSYLTDTTLSFGLHTATLTVVVTCTLVPRYQVSFHERHSKPTVTVEAIL